MTGADPTQLNYIDGDNMQHMARMGNYMQENEFQLPEHIEGEFDEGLEMDEDEENVDYQ